MEGWVSENALTFFLSVTKDLANESGGSVWAWQGPSRSRAENFNPKTVNRSLKESITIH